MTDLLPFHEAQLQAALSCNADLNRQFFAKSLELDHLKQALRQRVVDLDDEILNSANCFDKRDPAEYAARQQMREEKQWLIDLLKETK